MSENEERKKTDVKITVDNKATEELVKILKEKEAKEANSNEDNLADLKLQAYQKFKQPFFLDAPDKATLSAMLTNYISEIAERANPKQAPSGTAPANAQQYGMKPEDLYTRKFYDSQNMIEELRRLSRSKNPEEKAQAEQYIQEIFRKFVLDKRSAPTRPEPSANPNTPEALTELDLIQKDGFLVPRNKEDGDIGRLQKQWRLERKRRMEGKEQ